MKIELKKFGTTLISRQAGKEALAAFRPILADLKSEEIIEVDFSGVITFSPSWGDEFLTPLLKQFGGRLILKHTKNPSVSLTITTLEKVNGPKFRIF